MSRRAFKSINSLPFPSLKFGDVHQRLVLATSEADLTILRTADRIAADPNDSRALVVMSYDSDFIYARTAAVIPFVLGRDKRGRRAKSEGAVRVCDKRALWARADLWPYQSAAILMVVLKLDVARQYQAPITSPAYHGLISTFSTTPARKLCLGTSLTMSNMIRSPVYTYKCSLRFAETYAFVVQKSALRQRPGRTHILAPMSLRSLRLDYQHWRSWVYVGTDRF